MPRGGGTAGGELLGRGAQVHQPPVRLPVRCATARATLTAASKYRFVRSGIGVQKRYLVCRHEAHRRKAPGQRGQRRHVGQPIARRLVSAEGLLAQLDDPVAAGRRGGHEIRQVLARG